MRVALIAIVIAGAVIIIYTVAICQRRDDLSKVEQGGVVIVTGADKHNVSNSLGMARSVASNFGRPELSAVIKHDIRSANNIAVKCVNKSCVVSFDVVSDSDGGTDDLAKIAGGEMDHLLDRAGFISQGECNVDVSDPRIIRVEQKFNRD